MTTGSSAADPLDVLVAGAGVSGLYLAYRLLRDDPERRVAVFESSRRLGGRLLSPTPPQTPHLHPELGGMRFMGGQPLVTSLISHLGLDVDPLAADTPEALVHLRGQRLHRRDLTERPDLVPYELDPRERGLAPSDVVGQALGLAVPRMPHDRPGLLETLHTREVRGRKLHDWGFWNLLSLTMSHEAFRYAQKGMGYDTALHNWNAADTVLMNADFGPDSKYFRVRDGYDAVPRRLARALQDGGVPVHRQHRLVGFDTVDLDDGSTGVTCRFHVGDDDVEIHCRELVLAMPRRSIELLDATGAVLGPDQPEVRDLIESVTPNPLVKAALVYPEPWWEALGVKEGRSVTDLPARQLYYWGVERDQWGGEPSDAAVLLVYDDGQNVDFWAGFRDPTVRDAPERGGDDGEARWEDHLAPPAMVAELHRQACEAHGVPDAPEPLTAAWFDWGDDPYGGGVNFWNVGVRSWELIPKVARPVDGVPVSICGEAYSASQGWVEGALQTAELVLTEHLGVGAAPWPTVTMDSPDDTSGTATKPSVS